MSRLTGQDHESRATDQGSTGPAPGGKGTAPAAGRNGASLAAGSDRAGEAADGRAADPTAWRAADAPDGAGRPAPDVHAAAARIATSTGELLRRVRAEAAEEGLEEKTIGDIGDLRAHEHVAAELAAAFPGDAVRSEEDPRGHARHAGRVWIVDPLDGTREYREGRHDWAVHVALVEDGELVAGAVALPDQHVTYATGAVPPLPATVGEPRLAVSRNRPPEVADALAAELGARLVPLGSAGVKTVAVLEGRADAYVHAGGMYVWDLAAPVAVAREAGLHCTRLDGAELRFDEPDPRVPDLLVCRDEILEDLRAALARA